MKHTKRSVAVVTLAAVATALAVTAGASILCAADQDQPQRRAAMLQPPPGGPDGPSGRGGRGGSGGPGGFGGPGLLGPALFDLDLTAEQLQQVKSLREEVRAGSQPYQELLRRAQDELGALVLAESFDESAVRALAVTEAKAMTELRVIGARSEAAIYQLLTPDQRAKLGQGRRQGPGR